MRISIETGDDFLTVPQAAEVIGVSRITAWQWVKEGKIPALILGGKSLIPRATAEAFKRKRDFDAEERRIQKKSDRVRIISEV
ncbi:MAG: excisionase family DNA-binding protein [Dehalococcoidia bacterium]|nr:excisionase family DNA-binding protein [Dehalococcoidia bacterium]